MAKRIYLMEPGSGSVALQSDWIADWKTYRAEFYQNYQTKNEWLSSLIEVEKHIIDDEIEWREVE